MSENCPNCETDILVKYKDKTQHKKVEHQHHGYLDLENCPECGFDLVNRELVRVQDNRKTELNTTPPEKSKIDSFRYSDSILEINVPREGFSSEVLGSLTFGLIWLLFVAFITITAMQGSILFALFTLPFWSAGTSMIYGITKAIFEKQKIELNGKNLTITKSRLFNTKEEEIPLHNIESISLARMSKLKHVTSMSKPQKMMSARFKVPTIITKDGKTITLLDYGSEAEKIWLTNLLKEYMVKVHGEEPI